MKIKKTKQATNRSFFGHKPIPRPRRASTPTTGLREAHRSRAAGPAPPPGFHVNDGPPRRPSRAAGSALPPGLRAAGPAPPPGLHAASPASARSGRAAAIGHTEEPSSTTRAKVRPGLLLPFYLASRWQLRLAILVVLEYFKFLIYYYLFF